MHSEPSSGESAALEYAHFRVHRRPDGTPWTLGVGGMGVTYKAWDTRLRIDVALKVIHPARLGDRETQRLFVREARAAARVSHPNVATISFLEDMGGTVFYAMEYVDGLTLHAWMRRHGRPRLGQALGFAEQIAHGLVAIHEQHLIHRDLKPPNIMVVQYPADHPRFQALTASGGCLLKIIDFGLARTTGPGSEEIEADAPYPTVGFRGTVAYASPEQCREDPDLDARTDLYSLGCILWEMLAGQPPFVGRNHREVMNQHVSAEPPWVQMASAPPSVKTLLRPLLAKRREDRYADAAVCAQAFVETRLALGEHAQRPIAGAAPAPAPSAPAAPEVPPTPTPTSGSPVALPTAAGTRITVELPQRWWIGALTAFMLLAGLSVWVFLARRVGPPAPAPAAVLAPAPAPSTVPSVAVLRFSGLGGDAESDLFARGMSEDLLSSLGKVRGLRIISLGSTKVPAERNGLGLDQGRSAFLEGSVRRQGLRVRIATRLTDAASGEQLWSETYDRDLLDAFEIQRSVAQEIARALATTLTPAEEQALARRPTKSAEAYDLYLRGRTLWHSATRSLAVNEEIVALCERAVALDPDFALAWAYVARAHNVIYFHAFDRSPTRLARARVAAETAMRLQPDLAEAHIAFARVQWFENPAPEALLRAYKVALTIAPGNPEVLDALADIHRQMERPEEALAASREAASRLPEDGNKAMAVGNQLAALRRYAEAEEWFKRGLTLSGGSPTRALRYELCVAERTGDWDHYRERARGLISKLPPDLRWIEQWRVREIRAALETLEAVPGTEVAHNWQRVPKMLVTSVLRHALGEDEPALRDGRAALAAMLASPGPVTVVAGWQMKLALAHARAGFREKALELGEAALRAAPPERGAIVTMQVMEELAELCAEVGEKDRACDLLMQLLAKPWWGSRVLLRHAPQYDGLRAFPRFEAITARQP